MIRGMYVPLGHFSIYDHANQLRPSVPLSLSLSLSLAIRSRPDAGFSLYYIHIGIYTRGSPWPSWNYRHWRSWAFSGCCAICTRTVRNLKILIVTGARVAQYRVTHAWPNWIVMSKARLKTIYPECIFFFWILF